MPELVQDLAILRHSTAHVLAQAVLKKYPKAKLGIGPSIDDGFYYDFDVENPFTEEDLKDFEAIMAEIVKEKQVFSQFSLDKKSALERLQQESQVYKCELVEDLGEVNYSFYENGPFVDLCKGPHVENTGQIKAFKLLNISGAYWRGSEKNKMLQRIYGTAFFNSKDLRLHLNRLEEAKKRDHRKIGKELKLFSINEQAGPGLVLWHPKGASMRAVMENYWRKKHEENGYELVYTPHVGKAELWQTSGHLDFYQENMYDKMDVEHADYFLKPMNCPFHIMIYTSQQHSYRQLPVRYSELGTVYRYERSGVLHGLMRVRGFTQDDAHIMCSRDQVEDEIERALLFSLDMLKAFGFETFKLYVSTKPTEKSVGEEEQWKLAEASLKQAVEKTGLDYDIDEGGGAFYGPKIDIKIQDAIGRQWQCSTIQFDFNLPERFNMTFVNAKGEKERPFMIHRALLGSLERFFGILVEHYAGWFPAWMAPVQCKILSINASVNDYAYDLEQQLKKKGVRVECDDSDQKINYKVRQAITEKVPYMLVVGEKEKAEKTLTLRHKKEQLGSFSVDSFWEAYKDKFCNAN